MYAVEPLPGAHPWMGGWLVGACLQDYHDEGGGQGGGGGSQAHQPLSTANCLFGGCPQKERAEEAIGWGWGPAQGQEWTVLKACAQCWEGNQRLAQKAGWSLPLSEM